LDGIDLAADLTADLSATFTGLAGRAGFRAVNFAEETFAANDLCRLAGALGRAFADFLEERFAALGMVMIRGLGVSHRRRNLWICDRDSRRCHQRINVL
jgi:hypothetical protein